MSALVLPEVAPSLVHLYIVSSFFVFLEKIILRKLACFILSKRIVIGANIWKAKPFCFDLMKALIILQGFFSAHVGNKTFPSIISNYRT